MKEITKSYIRAVYWRLRAWQARDYINELISHDSEKLSAIGEALHEALNHIILEDEKRLKASIERRRCALLKSNAVISVIDYGAGSPGSSRTKEEMIAGVKTTAPVSKICRASKPRLWALLLFKLIRKLKPDSCLELGSCVGISASYIAAALGLNKKGKLLTLEGAPEIGGIAKETLEGLGLERASVIVGPFYRTYRSSLESAKPLDFLFNDGHHEHDAMLEYFHQALPYLAEESVIVFDDISWSEGTRKAWGKIENDEHVALTIDLQAMGIAVISKKRPAKRNLSIRLW